MVDASTQLVLTAVAPDRAAVGRLADQPFVTVEVHSADEAFDAIGRLAFSLVIIDADLPGTPWLDVCRALRADPRVPRTVPILILTPQRPTPEQRVKALQAGAWDFLVADGAEDLPLRVLTYLQAKRNMDDALAESLVDPVTGLHSLPGLARRARELGALLAREPRGALACVVFTQDGRVSPRETAAVIGRFARISDVVGVLKAGEFAVLAPATDSQGVIRLARRLEAALRVGAPESAPKVAAGYDAITSVRYSPMEPMTLLTHAASALHSGRPEPQLPWLRRYVGSANGFEPPVPSGESKEAKV